MTNLQRIALVLPIRGRDLAQDPSPAAPVEIPNVDRLTLAGLFRHLGYRSGAEIGVERGVFAKDLCDLNPEATIYGVDAWQTYRGYLHHTSQVKLDGFYQEALARLAGCPNWECRKMWSVDAAATFEDQSLDFVYLDGSHRLDHVIADLAAWVPKVRPGGIVSGHDYCLRSNPTDDVHVVEAVQAWTRAYQIAPWFVLGSKAIREGEKRDRPRSWFWVQPEPWHRRRLK